ncbi:MAG TPA: type II secretion system F family protein [Thermodesulfobacteriota bacterium]
MPIELVIFLATFAAILLFLLGVYFVIRARREHQDFLKRIERAGEGENFTENGLQTQQSLRGPIFRFMEKIGGILKPKKEYEISNLRQLFLKAGLRNENAPTVFFGVKALLAILFVTLAFLIKLSVPKPLTPLNFTILLMVAALLGLYLPNLWLKLRTIGRLEKIQQGLPDALDLMVVCVEAGTGLDAAVARVGEEMKIGNKTLSEEFRLLSLELRAGKTRRDALKNLALRTGLEDVSNLVTLLIQTEKFGTSIAQALRVHADFMRTKRFQKAEEIAAKMPLKLIPFLVLFIFPTFLLVAAGPALLIIFRVFLKN